MIDAKELRIGNWVSNSEKNYAVDANLLYDISYFENFKKNFFPIQLTLEILDKCGFEKSKEKFVDDWDDFEVFTNNIVNIGLKDGKYYLVHFGANYQEEKMVHCIYPNPIKYLHRLQNLYFDLTRDELQIELL